MLVQNAFGQYGGGFGKSDQEGILEVEDFFDDTSDLTSDEEGASKSFDLVNFNSSTFTVNSPFNVNISLFIFFNSSSRLLRSSDRA